MLVLSDTHGGHKHALCDPDTVLFDEDELGNPVQQRVALTDVQKWLWNVYSELLERTTEIAGDDEIVCVHLGDVCHGNKHPEQLISTRIYDQIEIAATALSWLRALNLRSMAIIAGTGAHTFGEASATKAVADRLKHEHQIPAEVFYHGLFDIDGLSVDAAHHGPGPGSRSWLTGNVARYYLRSLMMAAIVADQYPPELVLRGHYHTKVDEVVTVGDYESRIIVCPSMCFLSDYARQATKSIPRVTVGGALFEIDNGHVIGKHWITDTVDVRTRKTL